MHQGYRGKRSANSDLCPPVARRFRHGPACISPSHAPARRDDPDTGSDPDSGPGWFTIYWGKNEFPWGWHWHYTFVPDDADGNECFQIMNYPGLETRSDVSKQHWGSRFKGNVEEPDLLEWNSPATKHYTLYKNRGYTIWGLDGNNDGYCHVDHSFAYSCEWPNHPGFTLSGATAFRCFSNWIKIWPTTNSPWMKMALPGNHTGEEEYEVGEGFNKTTLF
ncbi:hypothetical protein PG987_011910 [Apiospora arundinis]